MKFSNSIKIGIFFMHKLHIKGLFRNLILINLFLFFILQSTLAAPSISEKNALADLYFSTNGNSWVQSTGGWPNGNNVCLWFGVICNAEQTQVTGLLLQFNNLDGPIPTSIGDLVNLTVLNLGGNKVSGSIPGSLSNLSTLEDLLLFENSLNGQIPSSLANISTLRFIDLNHNSLDGSIPIQLGNLLNLHTLDISSNKLTGDFPVEIINLIPPSSNSSSLQGGGQLSTLNIDYNALNSNSSIVNNALDNYCNCDWKSTQTIPPNNINVIASSLNSMSATWDPIAYQRYGSYLIYISTDELGPYTLAYETSSKTETAYTAGNLIDNQSYFFQIRTKTFPSYENENEVISLPSEPIQNFTDKTISDADFVTKIKPPIIRPNSTVKYEIEIQNLGPDSAIGANFKHIFSNGYANGTWQCIEAIGGAVCPSELIVNGNINLVLDLPLDSKLVFNLESDIVSQNDDYIIDEGSFIISTTITPPEDYGDQDLSNNIDILDFNLVFKNSFEE
jgi:hypothetical protein